MGKTVNVILKDKNGEPVTYTGIDTVKLPTDTGEAASFSLGGTGGAQAAKPEISIFTGEADENGWYPDACIATKNLLGGLNGAMDFDGASEAWQEKKSAYEQDGVIAPKARIVVQLSDKSAKDLADQFVRLGFTNRKLREWLQKALTQVQEIDFSTVAYPDDPEHINIAQAIGQGFGAPGGILNLGAMVRNENFSSTAGTMLTELLGYLVSLLYMYGVELDVTAQSCGWGEGPAASETAKWYFNYVVNTVSGSGFLSQNLVVGGKGLAMPFEPLVDKGAEPRFIPSHFAATDKTLLCGNLGANGEMTSEDLNGTFAYQLGATGGTTWVEAPLTLGLDESTGWPVVNGHGLIGLCEAKSDGSSPISSEKYAPPTVADGNISCAEGASVLAEYVDDGLKTVLKNITLKEFAATLAQCWPEKDRFAVDLRAVGMANMPSDAVRVTIDKEGNQV